MYTLSDNQDLPVLNGFAARSTWLIVVAAIVTAFNTLGIDLLSLLGQMGLGSSPAEVVATGERLVAGWQMVAPILLSVAAWLERRAPNFRLVWPLLPGQGRRPDKAPDKAPGKAPRLMLGLLLGLCVPFGLAGLQVRAEGSTCAPREALLAHLVDRYGEIPVGAGEMLDGHVEMVLSPDGSFTLLWTRDGTSCVLASGLEWQFEALPPDGEPT